MKKKFAKCRNCKVSARDAQHAPILFCEPIGVLWLKMSALSLAFQRAMARRVGLSIEGAANEGTQSLQFILSYRRPTRDTRRSPKLFLRLNRRAMAQNERAFTGFPTNHGASRATEYRGRGEKARNGVFHFSNDPNFFGYILNFL